jgi:peptidoglycan/LPS O-acetylase OafA/YrhL
MTSNRVNEIDLLRFLAALSVVIFHYSFRGYAADDMSVMPYPLLAPFSKYGYLGVELFFMISGFVILMSAANGSLRNFVVSRISRLYPAFWACCTITFLVTLAIGEPHYSASVGQYLVNMTMLNGFIGVPSIDGVYWSLFIELVFYALVSAVLIMGRIHQAQSFLVFWLLVSIALEAFPVGFLNDLLIVDYAAFFIAGASYFLIWSQGISRTRVVTIAAALALAIFQAVENLQFFEKHYNTSMSGFVVAGIIGAFFFVFLLISLRATAALNANRWALAGAITYPLYLIHQNVGFMVFNVAYPMVNPHVLLWGTLLAAIGSAFALHVLVERRFSSLLKKAVDDLAARMPFPMMGRGRVDAHR